MLTSILGLVTGCPHSTATPPTPTSQPVTLNTSHSELTLIDLSDPIRPTPLASPVKLRAAAEEWTSITLAVSAVQPSAALQLRAKADGGLIDADHFRAYQVLPAPIELNPDYVRHTGLNTASRSLPRVLLPLESQSGVINLTQLRDPMQPTNPAAHANGNHVLIWIDLRVPATAAGATLNGTIELLSAGKVIGSQALTLSVYDFAMPRERHLQMAGTLSWDRLAALYPEGFGDTITPALINRRQSQYAATVRTLDQLVNLAEENRLTLSIPGLRPTVKWPAGEAPEIDWREYDALVAPWLDGSVFTDRVGLGYWPLPAAQSLDRYDPQSRLDYWRLAAEHFEHLKKLEQCPIALTPPSNDSGAAALLAETTKLLQTNENVRVSLPLDDTQIDSAKAISAGDRFRIYASAPELMSVARNSATTRPGNAGARNRVYTLRTDGSDTVPYFGAGGSERDVRVWAWLAFLRQAGVVIWNQTLPLQQSATDAADAGQVAWFYPGSWYGVDQPVPTIQLKWLRRAQQDYEYLWLSKERGEPISALQMARLISKPLEVQPGQNPDPAYALLCGTPAAPAWDRAQELLAAEIVLHTPGRLVDPDQQRSLYIQTLQWAEPLERPLLMDHAAHWSLGAANPAPGAGGHWVSLKFGVDIYNASDTTPNRNTLRWSAPPAESGWEVNPESAVAVPPLQTYHIEPATINADFDLDRINPSSLTPLTVTFVNGFTNSSYKLSTRIPIAVTDRYEGPSKIDGRLDDWSDAEAIQEGPLLMMMNRPALQEAKLQYASRPARILSRWGSENLYLGFLLSGNSAGEHEAHNDVHYQARRAWDEDLAEALVQPIFPDNTVGPVTHVVFKPNGAVWLERKDKVGADAAWGSVEGAGIRYATTNTAEGSWRGEAAIPWKLLCGPDRPIPTLLRFNFTQHRNADCESASWCGPVDFGRDDQMTGLLYVRQHPGR